MFGFRDISHDVCNVLIHVSGLRSLLSFVYLLRLTYDTGTHAVCGIRYGFIYLWTKKAFYYAGYGTPTALLYM